MLLSRYERMIARRYLLPGKGEAFIFLVASISLVAVMLGVAALVIVMSVMNGFRAELFDKIVGLNGHAVVQGVGGQLPDWREIVAEARKTPGVTSAVPMIEQPLAATFNGRVEGIIIRGVRMTDVKSTIGSKIQMGTLAGIVPGSRRIAIGSRLAEELGATVGSEISLFNPQGQTTPFGTVPRIVTYTVGAIFELGLYDYGEHWPLVAATVGSALIGIVMFGSLAGSMLPFILQRIGFDPATASAPFVATLVDVTGLVIYFSVALLILRGTLL